jgi:diguanylate cyclase (GGDEF)-like protein/PAS domain S-box-containing protein
VIFYADRQENTIMGQNERAMEKVTESVIQGLESLMLGGYADIAEKFADKLKEVPEILDFRIMRTNGLEAFRDNETINKVNENRGEEVFFTRETEGRVRILEADDPNLGQAIHLKQSLRLYETNETGEHVLTFLVPILNREPCQKCHGKDHEIRGVVKLTTPLASIEEDIERTWTQAMVVMVVSLLGILLFIYFVVRRTIVMPINQVTDAMRVTAGGRLDQQVPIIGEDELSMMAKSFNHMTAELLNTYTGLRHEQNKLTTIILSAQEGIVVTDRHGHIVLVNPAAETLLGKSAARISAGGMEQLIDDPTLIKSWFERAEEMPDPNLHNYNERLLSVSVSTIRNGEGKTIGSSALIRDVTEEKRLEEELRTLSNTDALTGLFNRRYLDYTLKREVDRAFRYTLPLSILMFDVDFFKRFNDEHGHEMGDKVLQSIGQVMIDTNRTTDTACRYGGEEFLMILTNTDENGARAYAERLRKAIAATPVEGLSVTISIGVASAFELRPKDHDTFISYCDKALYKAKEAGRNCVVISTPEILAEESEH